MAAPEQVGVDNPICTNSGGTHDSWAGDQPKAPRGLLDRHDHRRRHDAVLTKDSEVRLEFSISVRLHRGSGTHEPHLGCPVVRDRASLAFAGLLGHP